MTVVWEQRKGSPLPIHQWLAKVKYPPQAVDEFEPKIITYCWQNGMSFTHVSERKADLTPVMTADGHGLKPGANLDELGYVPEESEAACNLQDVFFGMGQEVRPRLGLFSSLTIDPIDNPKAWSPNERMFRPDYFYQAGIVLPDTIKSLKQGAKSLVLQYLEQGAEVAKVDQTPLGGQPCLCVEMSTKNERLLGAGGRTRIFLDPSLGYAVRRKEVRTLSGQLALEVDVQDFVKFSDPDIWLPNRCDATYYTWYDLRGAPSKEPVTFERFRVKKWDRAKIPLEQFSLRYTVAGTFVRDATLPQAKNMPEGVVRYQVPPNPADLDAVIQTAIDGKPFLPKLLQEQERSRTLLLIGVNGGILGLVVVWLLWRRLTSPAKPQ
jgi:hypothetical protein